MSQTYPADGPGQARQASFARVKRDRNGGMLALAMAICAVVLLPILSLAYVALSGTSDDWPHLIAHVIPGATQTTLALLAMVAIMTSVVGVTTAWLVVSFEFPFRRFLSWALVLPLAVPPYLAAYAFGEFFHYTGPIQSTIREIFGFQTIRDYWFPDIRSTGGAALVLSSVLYPYVYLTTRIVFLMQGRNIADVARTLGARPSRIFWRVLLPIARPAIVAGVALVLMETINDIGAAEYLGVRTMTFAVYSTWLNRGSLEGGAQIALLMLIIVFVLLVAEQWARRRQRFHASRATHMKTLPRQTTLRGRQYAAALVVLVLPILAGFGIPLFVFGRYALRRLDQFASPALASAFVNSVMTALFTSLLTVLLALFLLNAVRIARSHLVMATVRLASVGYALPGGILGLGLLFVLARFDNGLDALAREHLGYSTGLLLTGSASAVVIACTIRFLALAESAVRSGIEKLPPNLDEAARSLGRTPMASARSVLLPLLRPAILTASVLVFVDTIKELSATILLRPFGFNTLATFVYENASRGVPEDGAVAALLIILTALVPVVLLSGALMRDRDASM
ncbi:iron ABC transporter permease [Mesorhizobium sp. SB112]|uniref:ABC transporter permease n=1 Tax=Mesorhizobium sp. SB112 TaxID=3151853 RepID=UPI0032658BBE